MGKARPPAVSLAPYTLRYSDATLEHAYLLYDYNATAVVVPVFSCVVCALSLVLVMAVPAGRPGLRHIYPGFVVIGVTRLLTKLFADEARALRVYCWTWVFATAGMFIGWVSAQRQYEIVTGVGLGFLAAVALLLFLVSAYLRLLIGLFWPRTLTLLCYVAGWASTWPRVSVLGWPSVRAPRSRP